MKRFVFKLQRLARVRAIEEQVARETWAAADRGARLAEESAERTLQDVREAHERLRRESAAGRIVPGELLQLQSLAEALLARRTLALQRARAARARAEVERALWVSHKRRLEGLARLELRDHEAWRNAESAQAAAEIDAVAADRAARKARLESVDKDDSSRNFA
jgi:flagellar export protein FliJ